METRKTFVLRGERIRSLEDFYDEVVAAFGAPAWFGRNLDAFADLLRGGVGGFEPGERIVLVWEKFGASARFERKRELLEIIDEAEGVEFVRG